jgi:hypothetical protein
MSCHPNNVDETGNRHDEVGSQQETDSSLPGHIRFTEDHGEQSEHGHSDRHDRQNTE